MYLGGRLTHSFCIGGREEGGGVVVIALSLYLVSGLTSVPGMEGRVFVRSFN